MNQHSMQQLISNFSVIISKYIQVLQKISDKKINLIDFSCDPLQLNKLFIKLFNKIFSDPDLIIKYQMSFFKSQLDTVNLIFQKYYPSNNKDETNNLPISFDRKDKRFKESIWEEHCVFAWLKEAYFTYATWLEEIVKELPKDEFNYIEVKRIHFIVKQFLDAISPSNFPSTNPEVLRSFFNTAGENFINGLNNLLNDIENSNRIIQIKTSDSERFKLGENIATTKGKVVYQNEIIQLIHYTPLEENYYSVPILIVSPFINKYYIMDLTPENSFIKWLLEKKYNVFLISWVNPDSSLASTAFEDYMVKGPIEAIDYICKVLKFEKVNAIGYCIGGTLLTSALAYMKAVNDQRINSISLMTTLIDFENAGDLSIFIDDHFIQEVTKYIELSGGCLDGKDMATSFNLLRANDMIWPFYINNYLLGKETFPFDLLHWNADSIRMPMELHLFYLKNMYKDNLLKIPGGITLKSKPIDVTSIDVPCFAVAAKSDHIVPWENAFESAKLFSGPLTFVLADSGHVAGMINHPSKNKYNYWTNSSNVIKNISYDEWFKTADKTIGSWWPYWDEWLKKNSGELVNAMLPEELNPDIIEDAPGSYVKVRC